MSRPTDTNPRQPRPRRRRLAAAAAGSFLAVGLAGATFAPGASAQGGACGYSSYHMSCAAPGGVYTPSGGWQVTYLNHNVGWFSNPNSHVAGANHTTYIGALRAAIRR
ncbi:MAG: hypothetical protein AAGD35_02115 [Actinomycetota bacterium]